MENNKKGQALVLGLVIFAAIIAAGGGLGFAYKEGWFSTEDASSGGGVAVDAASFKHNCGDTPTSSVTMNVHNNLNTTGDENYDVAVVCTGDITGHIVSLSDTTSPSASTFNCEPYTCKGVSASGAAGDSGFVASIVNGPGEVQDNGKAVKLTVAQKTVSIDLAAPQGDVLAFKQKDMTDDALADDDQDNTTTDYETDGVTFYSSTTDTAYTMGTGASYKIKQFVRASSLTDAQWGSMGWYVLLDLVASEQAEPLVKVDGNTLSSVKDQLNADEKIAYAGYEYVYKVENRPVTYNDEVEVEVSFQALPGVNPSTDPQVDYAAIGAYTSTANGNVIKYGAVKDDSSKTQVFALEDTTIDIS